MTHRSPSTAALAYRIWAYCHPRGWNVTIAEVAEACDVSAPRVSTTMRYRGWLNRIRVPDKSASRRFTDRATGNPLSAVEAETNAVTASVRNELGVHKRREKE